MDRMSLDHVDVLIVGAGLSGIGAACHLQAECPDKAFTLLEARESMGGTWDLFRYPGIRSDSDMLTLGYTFRPWAENKTLADGPSILNYVKETARDHDVERHIRYRHRVTGLEWSTETARWTATYERTDTGTTGQITANFVFGCTGYYRYEEGYTPDFPGRDRFQGEIIHPQHWPEDLDYRGKRVVVIGSGATAVTLVPAMADETEHITMLQRSPTYVVALPEVDPIAKLLSRFLPVGVRYPILRWKNILMMWGSYQLSRRRPDLMKRFIREGAKRLLPEGFDVDKHFKPKYDPWDERMCVVPDGDLFKALRHGKASIATDTIETFDETGIQLTSGEHLDADIIVTATGLNALPAGGVAPIVDGKRVALPDTMGYKGILLTGIPNLAVVVGYTNASWTLKCDLTCQYACRLINHMDEHGYDYVVADRDPSVPEVPFIDLQSGYVKRALHLFPKQGDRTPWRLRQNYLLDIINLRMKPVADEGLRFDHASATEREAEQQPVAA
jgi:cation diffusion facilitator CzcD-associated flavoprotein CzcO